MLIFILGLIVWGFVVGGLARLALPGPDPMPWYATIGLGLGGALLGGGNPHPPPRPAGGPRFAPPRAGPPPHTLPPVRPGARRPRPRGHPGPPVGAYPTPHLAPRG